MKTKRIIVSLALAAIFALTAEGQNSIFNYSRSDRNPITAAMASASLTNRSNLAWSALSNPSAAVFGTKEVQLSGTWQNWAPKYGATHSYSLASGYNNERLVFSIAATYTSEKPYDIITDDGIAKGTFSPKGLYGGIGIAYRLIDNLSIGANLKYFRSTLAEKNIYNGFGTGLMITFNKDKFTIAAGIQDLGPRVKGKGESRYHLPTSIAGSMAYTMPSELDNTLHIEFDSHYYLLGGFTAACGAQYSYRNTLFARAGYLVATGASPIASHASVGLGLKLFGFSLNAAYLLPTGNSVLKNSVSVSLGFEF